jgi:hypothetical protein
MNGIASSSLPVWRLTRSAPASFTQTWPLQQTEQRLESGLIHTVAGIGQSHMVDHDVDRGCFQHRLQRRQGRVLAEELQMPAMRLQAF